MHLRPKYMKHCVNERIFFSTSQGVLNKIKTIIQCAPVFFPSNPVSLKSAKLWIASKLILRLRKIFPRLDYLDCSNNFLFDSQMSSDIYYLIHFQQFRVAMEREAKKSLCYCCVRRWKILFLQCKDCFMSCSVSQTCVRICRIQNCKHNKIFHNVFCFFFAHEIWSPFYFALI